MKAYLQFIRFWPFVKNSSQIIPAMLSCHARFCSALLTYAAERSANWQQRRSITNFFMSNILATQYIYYSFLVYCLLN
jgi:hypothetical protein